ncbi:type III endosome membrane protein TEMP isoform X2 [Cololabis saira]|uniref:type III endosome membrane protein TEMP isoform X2 n=1 Tax=Cololabis saira TaxID=129043 RepID=UPI002AD4E2A5|nr:type III endosome membrane protein TEMP isoform X2 [Cololabis saira]
MESSANETITPTAARKDTIIGTYPSHNWEFFVGVLVTAISVSILIAILAKCQVVRRYLASYRHTRLRDADHVEFDTHVGRGIIPHHIPAVMVEDDDGFIEDNYIPVSERVRAQRAAENMDPDTEEELDEIEFTIT